MLDPNERSVLFEAMKPPVGHELSHAIGTTFTLDLVTLLATPLAFTSYGWVESEEKLDAIELLESVRRFVDRVTVFCQAGYIKAPLARQTLLGFLQEAVVEVQPPNPGGVFHPKVWALRFENKARAVHYRLLVLSRNHTFDRSWDTVFVLDGELTNRKRAYAMNHPLGDFIAALPGLAVRNVPSRASARAELVANELRRVHWELPPELSAVSFWPLGLDGYNRLPMAHADRITRLAVVSPFLTADAVNQLASIAPICALVSREESLAMLPANALTAIEEFFYLPRNFEAPDEAKDGETTQTDSADGVPAEGLHAKLYVGDDGWNARVWTGSLNATGAGFWKNVEFIAELYGKKSQLGVDALLGDESSDVPFRSLLSPFSPDSAATDEPDEAMLGQFRLDEIRKQLATSEVTGRVVSKEEPALELYFHFSELPAFDDGQIRAWPVTLGEASARGLEEGPVEVSFVVSREAVTPFLAVEIELDGMQIQPARFVLNVPMEGMPKDYQDTLLRSALGNREHVLRYLLFLLSESGLPASPLAGNSSPGESESARSFTAMNLPLAEELIRTLARSPDKLDQVYTLVGDLQKTPEGRALLPDDFDALWIPIWEARQRLR